MSAVWSLTGGERTWGGSAILVEIDPTETFGMSDTTCLRNLPEFRLISALIDGLFRILHAAGVIAFISASSQPILLPSRFSGHG
jgi:hypothetical protein